MRYKISLHNHTTEDPVDGYWIDYDIFALLDKAEECGFNVLAITCHKKVIVADKHFKYAKDKGILLISGVELSLSHTMFWRDDVLVLNCGREAEDIGNFAQLKEFRQNHPESFVIAPHPAFGDRQSIGMAKLVRYIDLFDAIEHSWFYTPYINFNQPAERIASKYDKPLICTSDSHSLKYFNDDFAIVEADELAAVSIFEAIRQRRFQNTTRMKTLVELFSFYFHVFCRSIACLPGRIEHDQKYQSG